MLDEAIPAKPDLRDLGAFLDALDKAEARCGFSLRPLREVAEIVAASPCAFDEVRLCDYFSAGEHVRAREICLEFWILRSGRRCVYFEVLLDVNGVLAINESTRFDRTETFRKAESDKCAAAIVSWYAREEKCA